MVYFVNREEESSSEGSENLPEQASQLEPNEVVTTINQNGAIDLGSMTGGIPPVSALPSAAGMSLPQSNFASQEGLLPNGMIHSNPSLNEALHSQLAGGAGSLQLQMQGLQYGNPNIIALQQQQQQQQLAALQQQQLAAQQQQLAAQQFAYQQPQHMALNGLQNQQMMAQMPFLQMQAHGLGLQGNHLGGLNGFSSLPLAQQMMAPGHPLQSMNLAHLQGASGMANFHGLPQGALTSHQLPANLLAADASLSAAALSPPEPTAEDNAAMAASILDQYGANGTKEPPFPLKLHQILSNPEYHDCICWLPHGKSWRILKPSAFEQVVIPLYFRHAKYASFMRQVNGWGFKRMVQGMDHNSYYHECFLRDRPELSLKMKRIGATKNAAGEAVVEKEKKKKKGNGKKNNALHSDGDDDSSG